MRFSITFSLLAGLHILSPSIASAQLADVSQIILTDEPTAATVRETALRKDLSLAGISVQNRLLIRAALARTLHLQERFEEAEAEHAKVLEEHRSLSGDKILLAQIFFNAAETSRALDRWEDTAARGRVALTLRQQAGSEGAIADSEMQLGIAAVELKRFEESRLMLQGAYDKRRKLLGPTAIWTVNAKSWLGRLMVAQGDHAASVSVFEQVYRERRAGSDQTLAREAATDLASALESTNSLTRAERVRREAITLAEASDGRLIAWLRADLGHNLVLQENWVAAEVEVNEARRGLEAGTPEPDFDLRSVLNDLSYIYQNTGRDSQAVPLLARILTAEEKALGQAHTDVAATLSTTAASYNRLGRPADALPLLIRARQIQSGSGDNKAVERIDRRLSATYLELKQFPEADAAADRALAALAQEGDTLDRAHGLILKGAVASELRRSRDWAKYFSEALRIKKLKLGWKNPETQSIAADLVSAFANIQQWDRAEDVAREWADSLAGHAAQDGYAAALSRLAHILVDQERWSEAESVLGKVSNLTAGRDGAALKTHGADAFAGLATVYQATGRLDRAELMHNNALQAWRTFPPSPGRNRNIAAVARHLGNFLMQRGRHKEAEPLLRESRTLFKAVNDADDANIAWAATALAGALAANGVVTESEQLYREALVRFRKGEIEAWLLEPLEGLGKLALTQQNDPSTAHVNLREAARIALAEVGRSSGDANYERLRRRQSIFALQVQSAWQLSKR